MNYHRRMVRTCGAVALTSMALGPLTACVYGPEPDNIRFGDSVRHNVALQTSDPGAGAMGLDGEKAEKTLRAYRGAVGSPQAVQAEQVGF